MKKILLGVLLATTAMSAQAADLAPRPYTKAPPIAPVYDWTGLYVGVNVGLGLGRNRAVHDFGPAAISTHLQPLGAVGGGQIGYNWQTNSFFGPLVFGILAPRIAVLGLNPHAGEGGHLGREEIEVITPVLDALRARGMSLTGPLPADTAFLPQKLQEVDAVLAMYHDQGLPVLKHAGFENAVNITLGLPYVRVAVDHGTALELAGRGEADPSSMILAAKCAIGFAARRARLAPRLLA